MPTSHDWFHRPTRPDSWRSSTDLSLGDLERAARAARSLGRTGRDRVDTVLAGVLGLMVFLCACGLLPLLIVLYVVRLAAVRRGRRLDRLPWETATPTHGAERFLASQVAPPEGLGPSYRRYRWWQVADATGAPVFGLVGARSGGADVCIVPFGSVLAMVEPMAVPGFWSANSAIHTSPHVKGYRVLHLARASGIPALAIRYANPARRREIDVLVYASEALGDPVVAVLSCLATFVAKPPTFGPSASELPPAPVAAGAGTDGGRSPAGAWPTGYGISRPQPDAHAWQ